MSIPLFSVRPVALFVGLISLVPSLAAQTVWNVSTGAWTTAGNWSPATVPTSGTDVQINNGGTASLTAAGASSSLYLGTAPGDSGTLLVSGSGHLTNSGDVFLGSQGTGTITISAGGQITSGASYLGYDQFGTGGARTGTVTVTGSGSAWNTGSMEVGGWQATGTLTVQNGGHVAAGSFDVGTEGVGTASVLSGGTISTSNLTLGQGTSGSLTINGAGSAVTVSGSTNVEDTGTLTVSDGGVLNTGALFGKGSTTVTGAGSTLAASSGIAIGRTQAGSLTISDGGTVTSANSTTIGDFASGVGTVIVTGTNSSLSITNTVYIGGFNAGTGILTVADGGTVTSAETINLAITGSATLNIGAAANAAAVAPGTLNAPRLVGYNTGTSQINFNHTGTAYTFAPRISNTISVVHNGPGTTFLTGANDYTGATTINAGALFVNNTLGTSAVTVNSGGTLGGSGTLDGLTTIASGGHLAPGGALTGAGSAGTLTFGGSLTLTAGAILDFQLGTTSDLIAVTGGTLTGSSGTGGITLNLSDAGGFAAGTYTLFNFVNGGTSDFTASDFAFGTLPAGTTASDYTFGLTSTALTLSYSGSAIPEPSTYAAIFGACALGLAIWRKRRAAAPLAA